MMDTVVDVSSSRLEGENDILARENILNLVNMSNILRFATFLFSEIVLTLLADSFACLKT